MKKTMMSKSFAVAGAVALALSGAACADADNSLENSANEPEREVAADATNSRGHEGAPVTLTGCLQEGGAMDGFILTRVNEPSAPVGTSGSAAATEQMRAAKHAYQLESDDDDQFEKLVGKQVRVMGTIEETSDLNQSQRSGEQSRDAGSAAAPRDERGNTTDRPRNTAERPADTDRNPGADRPDIDADDLTKVNVTSIVQVADACGAAAAK